MTATLAMAWRERTLAPEMPPAASNADAPPPDGGLQCLVLLATLNGDAFDAERVRREYLKPGRAAEFKDLLRIAIARALLTNPRMLIFDEATSALDHEGEHIIQDNMRAICRGRTVLVVAHRLSTVRHADRIIVMERGRMAEAGPHDALMRLDGIYAGLVRQAAG